MKKLIILVSLIALLASGMAFAQLTYNGRVYYGAISNFEDAPGIGWDLRSIFTFKVDDFNTAVTRIRMRNFGTSTALYGGTAGVQNEWADFWLLSSDSPFVDRAFLTTNITGALGMKDGPVTAVMNTGYYWVFLDDLSDGVSPFDVADVTQMDLGTGGKQAVFDLNLNFVKMVDLRVSVAPNDNKTVKSGGWKVVAGANIPVGPGKLYPQFTYGVPQGNGPNVTASEGTIIFAAKYTQAMGDIGLTLVPAFRYNLDDKVNGGNLAAPQAKYKNADNEVIQYYYALAGAVQYAKLANFKFGFLGYDGSAANRLEANLLLTPVPQFGVEVGTIINLDQDEYKVGTAKSALQVIDIGAFVMAGRTRFKFGYIALGKEGFADPLNTDLSEIGRGASSLKQGGMYFETAVSF